jgi:cysteine-rich repeat protein
MRHWVPMTKQLSTASARVAYTLLMIAFLAALLPQSAVAQSNSVSNAASTAAQLGHGKVGKALAERLGAMSGSEEVRIAVVIDEAGLPEHAAAAARRREISLRQQRVLDTLGRSDFRLGRLYVNLAGFSGYARAAAVHALERHPSTVFIYLDREVHGTLVQGVGLIGADVAQAAGFTGAGVNVAVLDTGIDTNHPDLSDDIIDERCYCDDGGNPNRGCCPNGREQGSGPGSAEDDNGHGTSVTGIITASGAVTGPGVAPDAGIVAIKVLRANGSGAFSDVAAALDWLLTTHTSLGVGVVNLSLSDGGEYTNPLASPCSGTNSANAIRDLDAAGVAVFLASGNDGHDDGISFPACTPAGISVGGVYDANVGSISWCGTTCSTILCTDNPTSADKFVCHSNSDEILDLLAPDFRTRTSALGGGANTSFGGTSAASPYAAALGALLLEQDPALTPADIRSRMKENGPMVTNPDNGLSFRRTDVRALFPTCGNSEVEIGEYCDDGNTANGDCCSATCLYESTDSPCDTGNACTVADACDGIGTCAAGSPVVCDDGLFCTGTESCDVGMGCVVGTPPSLDDGIVCTIDACDEAADVVTHTPDDAFCDNLAFCDGAEICDAAVDCIAGTPPIVDDGIACTIDGCDEAADIVTYVPNDADCDNGIFCDGAETCEIGFGCLVGAPPVVDDGMACTVDACDEASNLVTHDPDHFACDDSDPCTVEACDEFLGCTNDVIPDCEVAVPLGNAVALGFALLAAVSVLIMPRYARRRGASTL